MNGNDPIGCGLGAGRASGFLRLACEEEERCWVYSNTDFLGEEKVAFGDESGYPTSALHGHRRLRAGFYDLP